MRITVTAVLLLAVSSLTAAPAPAATFIENQLQELEQAPPASPECFEFVVVADSNTLKPLEIAEVYKQILSEVNVLQPNLVVHAGDIILGGAADGVPPQWDLFLETVAGCDPPYLVAPGNHDITDEATEQIWRERIGPTRYTFSYGNSLFVLLNSEEQGAVERISDEQVAWLEQQLDASDAENIFVFVHQPYFEQEGDPALAAEYWEKHWSNVAETFRGHPVRAVFAGHRHMYLDCGVRDGVRYVICGGSSVYGMHGGDKEGGFNHYLRVQVRSADVSWAVIKPGSILPEDAVTSARLDELYNIRNKWVVGEEVFAPLGQDVDQKVTVTVANPHDAPMTSTLTWETAPGWTVEPLETAYEVPAQAETKLSFHVSAASARETRFPVPTFATRYEQTEHGPAVDVKQDLQLVPVLAAARANGAIALDGELADWTRAEWMPMEYPVHFEYDPDDLKSRLAFQWDDENLYLAVETQDNEFHQPYAGDIVWSADNVEMFLDDWSWGLSLTESGPEVFLYWGVGVSAETVNTDVKLAVKRDGNRLVYEAAFPKSHLTPLNLKPGNSFRYNVLMNDLDPSGPVEARHWLQLVPQQGSPGSPKPTVKVVLGE